MRYREIKPNGFLTNFVQCFWEYESGDRETKHTILPDGYFDLIVEFEKEIVTTVKLTGVWTKPINVTIAKATRIVAIRFKLLATEYLFQQDIKSILDTTRSLPLSFWNINASLCVSFEDFVSNLSNRMERSIKHLKEIDNRKLKLFDLIYQSDISTVKDLSEKVFWSSRQINRYFTNRFGFPLKEFLKIVRCNASYQEIANGNLFPLTGFFDQPHFIRELKKYTGRTPKELYKNENDRFIQLSKTERY